MKELDENHSFNPRIAYAVGIEKAVLLESIYDSCRLNGYIIDGKPWMRRSAESFALLYPYMNRRNITRWLKELEQDKWIASDNLNHDVTDRTKWYTINFIRYEELKSTEL